ncbi:MAG: spsA 1, partial [Bacteroidetes bacterium]|nr:spsA 1 [Bacteroidota bacterium]
MSKVSFILPAYKGLFLRESILSILDQKYSNFELVIVNDKSPDDIKGIVSSFNDSRIKYYENEKNIGEEDLVANWNLCLSYATGKWGVLASDDDIYEKTFLSELIQLVEKYPHIDLVHCRHRIINGDGDVLGFSEPCLEFECAEEFIFHNIIRRRRQVAPNFMFRISALREIDGFVNLPMAWGS